MFTNLMNYIVSVNDRRLHQTQHRPKPTSFLFHSKSIIQNSHLLHRSLVVAIHEVPALLMLHALDRRLLDEVVSVVATHKG